ncbi:MAG TPA: hypothetical protein VKT77_19310, partial [Chthonomonadaceae bacterium]|nr:hypothetical protein [Chthonomonadaceae bacterium]
MRALLVPLLAILLSGAAASADTPGAPGKAALEAVTARGRLLAQYDRAAAFASDAVQGASPPAGSVHRYIAVQDKAGWKVLFGRLDTPKRAFQVAYEATAKDASLRAFAVKANEPPAAAAGFPLAAAKAIDLALADF